MAKVKSHVIRYKTPQNSPRMTHNAYAFDLLVTACVLCSCFGVPTPSYYKSWLLMCIVLALVSGEQVHCQPNAYQIDRNN